MKGRDGRGQELGIVGIRKRKRRTSRPPTTDAVVNVTAMALHDDHDHEHDEEDSDEIIISCLTWNLAEVMPEDQGSYTDFLRDLRGSDLICVCIQECENPKPRYVSFYID